MSSSRLQDVSDSPSSQDQRQSPLVIDAAPSLQLKESQASSESTHSVPVPTSPVSSTIGQRFIRDRAVISYGKKRKIVIEDELHPYSSEEDPHTPVSSPTSPTKSLKRNPTSALGYFDRYADLTSYTENFEISIAPSGFAFTRTDGSSAMLPSLC